MKDENLLTVILPTYNEAGNIVILIGQIQKYLTGYRFEIIVADDNSTDGTAQKIKSTFGQDRRIKLFIRKKDKGLANSIRDGIEASRGQYIIIMDTDFNHNPKDIPLLLKYKAEFDVVVGSRYIKDGGMENKKRYLLSLFYNMTIRFILKLPTRDNLSGFFIIKRKKLSEMDFDKIFYGYGHYFMPPARK